MLSVKCLDQRLEISKRLTYFIDEDNGRLQFVSLQKKHDKSLIHNIYNTYINI